MSLGVLVVVGWGVGVARSLVAVTIVVRRECDRVVWEAIVVAAICWEWEEARIESVAIPVARCDWVNATRVCCVEHRKRVDDDARRSRAKGESPSHVAPTE